MPFYGLFPIPTGSETPDPDPDTTLAIATGIVTDTASLFVTDADTVTVTDWPTYTRGGLPADVAVISRELVVDDVVVTFSASYSPSADERFYWRERVEDDPGSEWTGDAARTGTYITQATVPVDPPPDPSIGADVTMVPGFFEPMSQDVFMKPQFAFGGALSQDGVEVQWTTSSEDPPIESEVEAVLDTGTTQDLPNLGVVPIWTTDHKDGPTSRWATFDVSNTTRMTQRLRFRYRVGTGAWSDFGQVYEVVVPAPRVRPPAPTGVSITAGAGDGEVVMAADAQTDWGDGVAGELKMWTSATGEITFAAGTWTLPETTWGSTIPVQVYAVDSQDFKGEAVTVNLLIPGAAPVATESWAMVHFASPLAKANPATYRYGKSAHQIQYCHGGDRSAANADDAAFIMDVGGPWVTENAEDEFPYYYLTESNGLEQRNSASLKWDPETVGRFVYAAGANSNQGQVVGKRTGIYTTEDRGKNFTLRLSRYIRVGFSDLTTRSYRQLINYAPSDFDVWYFINPKDALFKSTNRGVTWSQVNGSIGGLGQCWYLQVDRTNPNTIWIAAETGLYKSTNGGSTITKQNPSGLPGTYITSLAFDPDDHSNFMACSYLQGIYRTTNGGSSFSRLSTPHSGLCQVTQSPVDKNVIYGMGVNASPSGAWGQGEGIVSFNGGSSWTKCNVDGFTYGIDRGSPNLMRAFGGSSRVMANNILPSPTAARKAIATWGHCLWRTGDGLNWKNSSDGFSNHAGGDVNLSTMDFVGDDFAMALFDKKVIYSTDKGDSWVLPSGVADGQSSGPPVGLTVSIKADDTSTQVLTEGQYNPGRSSVVITRNKWASSFRPGFFSSNYGDNDYNKWAHFHKTGAPNVLYTTTAYSGDAGNSFTKWTNRGDSLYRSVVGEPTSSGSGSGVRAASPADNDWIVASNSNGRTLLLSKNRGVSWETITTNGPGIFGSDLASFWMDPTDRNIMYWWRVGTGMIRYNYANDTETACPGTAFKSGSRVTRIRSSYQTPNHIYFFIWETGVPCIYRSTTGWNGTFTDITGNLPRQTGNQGLEIDPATGILWLNGVVGTRIFPPPGGSGRWTELQLRSAPPV